MKDTEYRYSAWIKHLTNEEQGATQTQHTATPGVARAAERVVNILEKPVFYWDKNGIADIIDEETHATEMLTFIEKVRMISIALEHEALELIEKARKLQCH